MKYFEIIYDVCFAIFLSRFNSFMVNEMREIWGIR